ncbi:hypothetical protein DYBT9275_04244 [Dyadobacter sp. CECT 9275]|uniref:Uncharacterized protein n=1 Tax=Dyadobacter helix TaxID=2822344 RepID=A0A916N649_9BACT|nr:hypothetical protein [Dyadobacter sp. CECT 9275]CAG5008337.1 hypothetical protein DYBT9275_04244 [Dyadobacter sp. CECT 9275]
MRLWVGYIRPINYIFARPGLTQIIRLKYSYVGYCPQMIILMKQIKDGGV